ncbi:Tumor necrosis factor, alpha-induced protein 8-like protein 2 A [Eumeta japonica]|uniref:Tumor necrosis factor, alpha-induced protein 8-like protein 2 A n=1 Tax=Eumeta variegata TaxID=151549 RepID=A0A4C1SX09_EUMVA|nr:Tumor necrosis factor, alpha-induced protein 8-like protein 2 A [Eumeta japonica]
MPIYIYAIIIRHACHSAAEGGGWCARDISLRAQKKFLSRVGGTASARALVLDEHATALLDQIDIERLQLSVVLRERLDKREAEKLVKHAIKAAVKLGVLRRHGQLAPADERALHAFRSKFHVRCGLDRIYFLATVARLAFAATRRFEIQVAVTVWAPTIIHTLLLLTVLMAVVSFCEVDFSYDRGFLQAALRDSHQALKRALLPIPEGGSVASCTARFPVGGGKSVVERHLSDKSVSRLAGVFAIASRPELLDALFAGQVAEDVLKLTRMLRRELDRGVL